MHALPEFVRRVGAVLAALATNSASMAADDGANPRDYSHLIPLQVSGRQAVYQVPIPREVYLHARSPDLRDVRVFDASGKPALFALVEPDGEIRQTRTASPVAVFPVRAATGSDKRLPEGLQILTSADGAVISVTASTPTRPADEALTSLVLDMRPPGRTPRGSDETPVSALELTLPATIESYSAVVAVDASDDLQHWSHLGEAPVSWLVNSQGQSMRKNRIELQPSPLRYARLRWLEGKPVEFAAISAERIERVAAPQPWESLVLQAKPGPTGPDLAYAAPIAAPVRSVGLIFGGSNVILPAQIGHYVFRRSRDPGLKPVPELETVASATFYRMTQDGRLRASDDIVIPATHASQWVVRPLAEVPEPPQLRLRWKAATVFFVASGKAPYTLAFGRQTEQGARHPAVPLSQVAPGFSPRELAAVEVAQAGEPVIQHVNPATDTDQAAADGHRTLWLGGVLLCGVAALGAMAWRLTRQMKGAPPDGPVT